MMGWVCNLEHLNKSGVVPWLERQVPQLHHSCNTHQVQQSHNGTWRDLGQETCAKSSWVFCVSVTMMACSGQKGSNLIHTKTPSFWCVSPCATNPCSSHEHLPEVHSTTISYFTVLSKKNMNHICFLSPVSHFFHSFPLHTSIINNGSCEERQAWRECIW